MSASNMIKVYDIHGGVHPPENKHQSVQTPIQTAPIPDELILPLSQHIGAPAEAIVSLGDKVLKGQKIAKASGFVSVPIHAPTSGEVIAIEARDIPHSSGMTAPCIVIKPDHKETWAELSGVDDYTQLDKAALVDIIRDAGIAGMGGAGFPSAVKLNTRPEQTIETLIINGTECEPYITADDILMRERANQIIEGVKILRHIISPSENTIIGVEDNKPEGIAALRKAAEGTGIIVAVFPTKYPSGGEKQLIQIITGKEVPSGGLPADIGIVCQNIGTTVAIYKAVTQGEPLISRITTVTGNAVEKQQNYEVLLGTPMKTLLQASGFQANKASRLIMGGPMMGFALQSEDIPVVKTTNCILAPTEQELPTPPPAQACIRCGMCAEACPVTLLPQQLYWFAQSKNHEQLEAHHLFDCIECGACSFACPSNIPLVQYYRASKADIRQAEADQKKADYSLQRFEARQERLERAEAEKEAKRKERQEKAALAAKQKEQAAAKAEAAESEPKAEAVDPVQAAIERAKAKAEGNVDPVEEAKAKISGLEKRLEKAKAKLETAKETNDDNLPAFESSVTKLEQKLAEAQTTLAQQNPASEPPPTTDPVQAAIDRAKAKAEGKTVDPVEEAKSKIASLEKRLIKAEEKLKSAQEMNDDNLPAFESSVEKLKAKLEEAKKQLPSEEKTEDEAPSDDPVQAAIARAQAKRAGKEEDLSPKDKLTQNIASLEKRINNAKSKLEIAESEGSDKADALKTSLEKLEGKLADAKTELEALS